MTEDAKWLYSELKKRGADVGNTEAEFEQIFTSNEDDMKWLHETSKNMKLDVDDGYDTFVTSFFPKENKEGFLQRTFGNTAQAQMYAKQAESEAKKKEEERIRQEKINLGISDKDKQDVMELVELEQKAANPVSISASGVMEVHIPQPVLNQYGMPTNVTKPVNPDVERQVETKKAQMPAYLTRGENTSRDIADNAYDRAMNTEEGKNIVTSIQNKYKTEFKQSEAHKALLKDFYAGKVTEADINNAFVEQYGKKINDEIWEGILGENGLMREYYDDAQAKLDARLRETEAFDISSRIKAERDKKREDRKNSIEFSRPKYDEQYNEAYKAQFGVYPEDDPLKDLHRKGFDAGYGHKGLDVESIKLDRMLNHAEQFNNDALDLIDAVNNKRGFGKGIANALTDIDTFDMGIAELSRTKELIEILDKVDADEQLSEREELMLDAALNYFAVTSYYSNKLGRGYKAGQTTGASLPFIAQFMLTSGALASAEAAVKGGAQSLGKKIVKNLVKHGNKKLAKVLSSKAVTVPLATIGGLAEAGLEAGVMTAVFGMPKIEAGTQSRMLGEVNTTYNPETGEMEYLGRTNVQDENTARRNATVDTYVEYLSEMVLAKAFDPVGEWLRSTNMYKNILRTDIAGAIVDAWSHPTWKSIRTSTKFGSLPEEILEEELGGLLRLGLASDVNTAKEAGLDLDSQIDIVLGLAPTSIMFGAVGAGTYYGSLRRNAKHIRQSLSSDAQRELFDKLMEESRSGQFGDLAHDMIRNIVLDNEMSVEDKKANITSIVGEYQDLLSQETQKLAQQVNETENAANIDEYISNTRNNASDKIYQTIDSKGRVCSIVDGRVEISQNEYGWNQVDQDKSSTKVRVRYRKEDGSFTEPIEMLTSELTAPVNVMNTEKFKEMALAKSLASTKGEDTFEYDGVVYDTTTGIAQGTVEEYAQQEEERKKKEEENNKNNEPRVNTRPHKINGVFTVTVNGKEVDIKVYSNNATQKNDGSIKGGTFSISVDGKVVTGERREMYVEALSEKLKANHAKAVEEYNQRKAEEEAAAAQPVEPVAEEPLVSEEDRVKAAAEAEKRSKIEAFPKDKAGNVLVDKLSPEEYFLYIEQENGVETATTFIAEQLAWEYQAIADIEASNKSPREKQTARMKHQAAIKGYEDAIVKYVGQESLDQITAARAEALQNTPPVQEGAPVVAPVVEQAQGETPPTPEPIVVPEQETPQDDVPAEPDTTPLPPAEPEIKGATIEPIDLGGDDIVFVSNSSNVTRVAQRKEDGNLYFVDNGKPVSSAWKETASKVRVYYNGRPYYLLSKTARIGKNGSVVGLNITVHLAPEMYTGKDSELNEIPRDKISLDEQGNQTATGNKLAERVANYKSLSDFFNKVIYNAGGVKLTLGELLEIPVVNANKGKGAPSWQFQVKRFIEQQEGKRNQTDVRADIEAGLKELIADWNAYVKANGLTDVVTEDNATDYYNRLKELGGYTSNGLLVQSTDFNGGKLNSADATKNPILQLLVMLDQASELASEKGPSLRALEVSNIRGYVQKKPSSMTTEEIEAEMFLTNNQGERVRNYGISTQRYNALNAELERRQAPEREAQGQLEKELDEKERNQEEQLIDSYANEIVNLLAASSNGNAIQKAAARGRVIDMLKGNSTLRKGVYDKLASMQNEDNAEVIESAMNLIAKHYPEAAKTSTKKAEQEKPKPATSTPSLKELNDEYNDIKSKLDEYYYETEDEIDAANKRLAELRALLENTEFMIGDVLTEHAESTKRIIKILKAAGIRVVTFKNDELPKYVSKKKLEELSDGQIVYGFASNDTIYLNEDHFNPNSPLHEFTHLWVTAYKQAFPNEWKRFVEIANKSALAANLRKPLKDGNASPYAELNADEMASEVLSRYTGYLYGELDAEGRTAFENMMQAQTMEEKLAEKSLLNRIRNIWKKIISWFDKSIENEKKEETIDDMIRRFAQAPMETLARGREAVDELKQIAVVSKLDAEYMDAVNRGDMETAQRLVNEAAKMSMPNTKVVDENGNPLIVFHGSPYSNITTFDHTKGSQESGLKEFGTYFTSNPLLAELYKDGRNISEEMQNKIDEEIAKLREQQNSVRNNREYDAIENEINLLKQAKEGKVYPCFLNIETPKEFDAKHQDGWAGWHELKQDVGYDVKRGTEAIEAITGNNKSAVMDEQYDGIIAHDIMDIHSNELKEELFGDAYLVWNPTQIKSAEPVTYDDNGNVIPLSERFNLESDDMRYMLEVNTQENLDNSKKSSTFVPTNKVPKREKAVAYSALFAKTKGEYTKGIDFALSSNYMHYFRNGEHIGAIEINGNEDLIKLINKEVYGINESTERFAEIAKTIGDEYRSNYRNHDRAERLGERNDRDDTVRSRESSERGANQREVFTDNAEREQIIAEAKANGIYMLAPNGKPTNLTEDMWVSVRTQAFKDWFGDWQNDKDNASVVLDENGEPLVVFHGSRMAGFDQFGRGEARDSQGIYTTPNRRAAESYATSVEEWKSEQTMPEAELGVPDHHGVYSLFVNMRNPKVIDFGGKRFDEYGEPKYEVATNEALDNGERGILFDTLDEAEAYIAEHPEEDLDYVEKRTTSDDMLVQAKEEGYDGVIFTNIIDSRYPDPITNYVPFESNQVKSATQNIGTFNPEDNRIEFMIGPATPAGAPLDPMLFDAEAAAKIQIKTHKLLTTFANPKASLPEEFSAMRELVATSLDRTEGIRWMQESIKRFRKEQGLPKLGEGFDVRTMIEAMDSKIQNDTQAYINTTEKRLRKNIKKLADRVESSSFYKMHKTERELDQNGKEVELTALQMIERYLIACDSIEREQLNGNPRGLADFYRRMGMDVYEFAEAFNSAFFSSSKGKQQFDELWDSIRACTNVSIDMGWQSGLISLEEYTEYKKRRYYVPERDFAEVENNEELAIDSHGYRGRSSNKLTAIKQAKGGDSLAANVLANICLHARDGIIKSHRNTVKKAMYDLLRANEEWCREYKVPIPKQVWYQKNEDGTVSRMVDGPSAEDRKLMADLKSQIRDIENEIINLQQLADAATDESVKEAYENDIADLREQIDMLTDMFPYLDEFDTRSFIFMTNAAKNESTVMVYVDGVAQEMIFPNMSIIAKALNGTYNKEGELEPAKKIGQAFAAGLTVYNPAFFTVNVTRDIPFILKKGSSEYGFMFAPRFIARLAEKLFNRNLWKVVWNSDYKSLKDEHLREFFAGGANTGYTTIPEIRELKEATKGWAKKTSIGWSDVKDLLSYMNTFSEVWTRSAAYSVVRDMGHTNEEAIKAAKNLSVNFNRKGLGNPFMNFFGSMSIFMNAAIQGACGYWRTFKGNEDTLPQQVWHGTRAAINFMLLPAFVGFIDTLLNPDDDDEKLYYSDYDRDNYALLGFLHEGIRIPLNEQVKPFWCMGVNIALGMQKRRTKEQITNSMVSTIVTNLLPLPPVLNSTIVMAANGLTGQKDFTPFQVIENMITPQALSGIYDLSNNVNFMGTDIRIEAGDRPQYMLGENEEYFCRQVAWWAYLISGGNRDYPSRTTTDGDKIWADWNPKQVSAVRNMVIPSTYRDETDFFTRVIVNAAFPDNPYHGEEAKWEDFATVRRFYKPRDREMGMYSITKDAKAIVKANNERKANAQKLVKGGAITKNNAMRDEAELRLRQTLSDRDADKMSTFITIYEQLSIRERAKEYGLTEKQFMKSLHKNNPSAYNILIYNQNVKREDAANELLKLTRKYKSISIEDMTLLEAFGIEK